MNKKWLVVLGTILPSAALAAGDAAFSSATDAWRGGALLGNGLKAVWQLQASGESGGGNAGKPALRATSIGLYREKIQDSGQLRNASPIAFDDRIWSDGAQAGQVDLYQRMPSFKTSLPAGASDFFGLNAASQYFPESSGRIAKGSQLWALGLNIFSNGLFFQYGHQELHEGPAYSGLPAARVDNVEAGYLDEAWRLSLGYQTADGAAALDRGLSMWPHAAGVGLKTQEYALTAAYSLGLWTPRIRYAQGVNRLDGSNGQGDANYRQWVMGVDYNFSKQTKAAFSYGLSWLGGGAGSGDASSLTGAGHRENALGLEFSHWF